MLISSSFGQRSTYNHKRVTPCNVVSSLQQPRTASGAFEQSPARPLQGGATAPPGPLQEPLARARGACWGDPRGR
eukprot:4923790-Alexandrium_andersonii.AAC.1